ncbi:MAG: hypothetical protein CL878_13900 [Dehalococcoidia bacterium]|nr:hypothetical protein [Dehalococcoidia bacterium]
MNFPILARWQPAVLLGLALLVGGFLRFAGLYDRLEPIHRESELVILAHTRAPDPPQAVETYGPGGRSAGPAVAWRRLLGIGREAIERGRLASALAGVATIFACWWVARLLAGWQAASVAAGAYSIAPLAIVADRLALPVSTATLCAVLAAGCAILAYQRRRWPLALPGLALLLVAALLHGSIAVAAVLALPLAIALRNRPPQFVRSRYRVLGLIAGAAVVATMLAVGFQRVAQGLLLVRNLGWTLVFDLPVGGWVLLAVGAYFVARHGTAAAKASGAAAALLTAAAVLVGLPGGRGSAPAMLPAFALWIVAAASLTPRFVRSWHRLRADHQQRAVAVLLLVASLVAAPALLLAARWSLDPANAEIGPNEQWEYQAGPESGVGCTSIVDALRAASDKGPITVAGLGSRHSCLRMRIVTESLPFTWQDDPPPRSQAPPLPALPDGLHLAQTEYLVGQNPRAIAPRGWEPIVRIRRPQGVYGYALYRQSNPRR